MRVKFIVEEEVVRLLYPIYPSATEKQMWYQSHPDNFMLPLPSVHSVPTLPVLPAIRAQLTALSWPIAHIQLTEVEAVPLCGIPVMYARDLGFLFEPDHRAKILKICPSRSGYTN